MILNDPWEADSPVLLAVSHWNTPLWAEWIDAYKKKHPEALFIWTGSRIIGGAEEGSDWDLVVYCKDALDSYLQFETISNYKLYLSGSKDASSKNRWLSISDGELNIILTEDCGDFYRWDTATELATALGLHSKPHRVQLFESLRVNGQDNRHNAATSSMAVPF